MAELGRAMITNPRFTEANIQGSGSTMFTNPRYDADELQAMADELIAEEQGRSPIPVLPDRKLTECEAAILDALAKGPAYPALISRRSGYHRSTISRAVHALEQDAVIWRKPHKGMFFFGLTGCEEPEQGRLDEMVRQARRRCG